MGKGLHKNEGNVGDSGWIRAKLGVVNLDSLGVREVGSGWVSGYTLT